MDNTCVCCGAVIPEGRQVCPSCEGKKMAKDKLIYASAARKAILKADPKLAFVIDNLPAVEVVHGEWGEIYTCHGERLWGYRCSQCEADNSKKSTYCPNCGAKMDGGNEDG